MLKKVAHTKVANKAQHFLANLKTDNDSIKKTFHALENTQQQFTSLTYVYI